MKKFLVMMIALVLAIGTQAQETVTLVGQVQDVFLKRPLVAKISVDGQHDVCLGFRPC